MRDYKKVCRCRDCGKIYDKGIPYICSKCGAGLANVLTDVQKAIKPAIEYYKYLGGK